jgi:CRP-like cAMP-binding protein/tetratricopeptide (TPR) repeat protein
MEAYMLNHLSLFSDLTQSELDYLSQIVSEVSAKRGDTIFNQGDTTRDFYIIKTGQVEISVRNIFKERQVLAILKNGEFFGEMSLFDKSSARSATATAFQNTTLVKIPGAEFERILREQPSISYKLLGTMSKRLKEFLHPSPQERSEQTAGKRGKIITICSPRDGYGKTTFGVSLVQLLSSELPRKVLLIDLDLSFGDATFLSGVYSPRSILDLAPLADQDGVSEDTILKFAVRKTPNLTVLPAPKDLVDAERLRTDDLVMIINSCRRYFDYIVIDTHSAVSDVLLNAMDMADYIFFLINVRDSISFKSHSLFFQAVGRMNLPESHCYMIGSHQNAGGNLDQANKVNRIPIIGELPILPEFHQEAANMPYLADSSGRYASFLRELVINLLKEDSLRTASEPSLFSRLFSSTAKPQTTRILSPEAGLGILRSKALGIHEDICAPLMKEIRIKISRGFLEEAQRQCFELMSICPGSIPLISIMGEIFFLKHEYGRSLEAFERVLELEPDNYIALGHLARIRGSDEMMEKALKSLSAKIKRHPEFPDMLNEMGVLLMGSARWDEALDHLERALKLNPEYIDAQINLSIVLGEMGRDPEAIARLMDIRNKNVKVFYLLGNFFFKTNRFFEAMTAFTRVSSINPHYADTDQHLENLRNYFAKLNNLLEMHLRLAQESPNYPDIHLKIGNLYLLAGKRDEAMNEFLEAVRLKPDYAEALERLESVRNGADRHFTQLLEESLLIDPIEPANGTKPQALLPGDISGKSSFAPPLTPSSSSFSSSSSSSSSSSFPQLPPSSMSNDESS